MPRKGENIYKRKDGRWEGRYICGYKSDGTSKYRSVYGHAYMEVKEKLKHTSILTSRRKVSHNTLSDISSDWLDSVKNKHKISTYNKYKTICNLHIIPCLGKLKIELIENKHIESLLDEKNYLSPKTRSDILCVIKLIFAYARKNNYHLLVMTEDLFVRKEYATSVKVLSLEEQKKLSDYLLTDINYCKLGVFLALYTGVRIGELCSLQCSNIDFNNALLHVDSTMQRVSIDNDDKKTTIIISSPKTQSSIRDIPLPEFLINLLNEYYKPLSPSDYLLTGNSKYMEPRTLRNRFRKYLLDADIENIKFHALRHSFATRCIELGVDVKTLSEILGHSNVNITLNRYVHSSLELKRHNMDKLTQICN